MSAFKYLAIKIKSIGVPFVLDISVSLKPIVEASVSRANVLTNPFEPLSINGKILKYCSTLVSCSHFQ
jgi:hypothetical protein